MPRAGYDGTLRPIISLIPNGAKIDWVDVHTREVVWFETCTPKPGHAFASQIECHGSFQAKPGYFVDAAGLRHFVVQAEAGVIGSVVGR